MIRFDIRWSIPEAAAYLTGNEASTHDLNLLFAQSLYGGSDAPRVVRDRLLDAYHHREIHPDEEGRFDPVEVCAWAVASEIAISPACADSYLRVLGAHEVSEALNAERKDAHQRGQESKQGRIKQRDKQIVAFVDGLKSQGCKDYITQAARKYNVSISTVKRAISKKK